MKTIHVDASVQYDVLIAEGLLKEAGKKIKNLGNVEHAVIVSDDNVFPIYGETIKTQLESENIRAEIFVFAHGEQSKSLTVYGQLMEYLCSCHLTRNDILIALGGGVTGDLTGFAAATYQRGIRFVQIPTTLLAAVDSSVGGKTAVNLSGGKNQAGCFYQPSLVLCDSKTLDTLPEEEFASGSAEVIKYGMIGDSDFLEKLGRKPIREWLPEVIAVCVAMKRDVVMKDEFDKGDRMLLNFGHTLGHGVEKCSNYSVAHGKAVAMGMAVITKAAEELGFCEKGTYDKLVSILEKYQLPVSIPYSLEDMLEAARSDKKNAGSMLRLIVPERAGICKIKSISMEELKEWMKMGGIL